MTVSIPESVLLDGVRRAVAARARAEEDLNKTITMTRMSGVSISEIARAAGLSEGRTRDIVGAADNMRIMTDEEVAHVLTYSPNVLVVAAGKVAYPEYRRYAAYVCQRNRGFNGDHDRLGFYANQAIMPEFPTILHVEDDVVFTRSSAEAIRTRGGEHDAALARVIGRMLDDGARHDGFVGKVFLLSPRADETQTLLLPEAINHTTTGPGTGFTQKHRYVSEGALMAHPKTTDELLRIEQAN